MTAAQQEMDDDIFDNLSDICLRYLFLRPYYVVSLAGHLNRRKAQRTLRARLEVLERRHGREELPPEARHVEGV